VFNCQEANKQKLKIPNFEAWRSVVSSP
jgi:hypothetical protein